MTWGVPSVFGWELASWRTWGGCFKGTRVFRLLTVSLCPDRPCRGRPDGCVWMSDRLYGLAAAAAAVAVALYILRRRASPCNCLSHSTESAVLLLDGGTGLELKHR